MQFAHNGSYKGSIPFGLKRVLIFWLLVSGPLQGLVGHHYSKSWLLTAAAALFPLGDPQSNLLSFKSAGPGGAPRASAGPGGAPSALFLVWDRAAPLPVRCPPSPARCPLKLNLKKPSPLTVRTKQSLLS